MEAFERENPSADLFMEKIIERFFELRRDGLRVSVDDLLEEYPETQGRSEFRAKVLQAILKRLNVSMSSSDAGSESSPEIETETPGIPTIEGYEIVRSLGEGGMGVVYEAIQKSTGRRVAVKFLRDVTLSSHEGRRRFEREVEIVARLNHPNIVSVLDSGIHRGRYFYVMDFVDGKRLDEAFKPGACDVHQALGVMRQICEAVDYAHQRGVLHRDLKPSNIVINERGQPLLLDFGLAKEIQDDSGEGRKMTLSEPGQILGTLGYMPPEQTRGDQTQVSVRSDVYSLGAMAYELVTGTLPCDVKGTISEVLERITEKEPKPPSLLLGKKLGADLDAVLLKSLEKSPQDRYATAADLAEDLDRYLSDEIVLARRASITTRALRWTKRHRAVASVSGIAALLMVGLITVSFFKIANERDRASRAADAARAASAFWETTLDSLNPQQAKERTISVHEFADSVATRLKNEKIEQPQVKAAVHGAIGNLFRGLGLYRDALEQLQESLKLRREVLSDPDQDLAKSLHDLAAAYWWNGEYDKAEPLYREALAMRRKLFGNNHTDVALTVTHLAACRLRQGDLIAAEAGHREALAIRQTIFGREHADVAASLNNLAKCLIARGNSKDAEPLFREALSMIRKIRGPEHQEVAFAMNNLASCLLDKNDRAEDLQEAQSLFEGALALRIKFFGEEHPQVATTLFGLARAASAQKSLDQADAYCDRTLKIQKQVLRKNHPDIAETLSLRGAIRMQRNDANLAVVDLYEAWDIRKQALPEGHWLTAETQSKLGECLTVLGRYDDAESKLLASYPVLLSARGEKDSHTQAAARRIVNLYELWGKPEKAAPYRPVAQ